MNNYENTTHLFPLLWITWTFSSGSGESEVGTTFAAIAAAAAATGTEFSSFSSSPVDPPVDCNDIREPGYPLIN